MLVCYGYALTKIFLAAYMLVLMFCMHTSACMQLGLIVHMHFHLHVNTCMCVIACVQLANILTIEGLRACSS